MTPTLRSYLASLDLTDDERARIIDITAHAERNHAAAAAAIAAPGGTRAFVPDGLPVRGRDLDRRMALRGLEALGTPAAMGVAMALAQRWAP